MSSVYVSNLSTTTSKESLDKFMAFCGSIQNIEMHEGHKAIVTFEKPSAASTALMLNGGTLDGSPIQVSSEHIDEDTPTTAIDEHEHHDTIPQEAKPRSAIVAEYIAHGYILSDSIVQKAVVFDQKHGISSRFQVYFNKIHEQAKQRAVELEAQTGVQRRSAEAYAKADEKVKINERANKAYGIGKSYYEKVLGSEFGQQALQFYTDTSNNIKSVHEEASRIAASKKQPSATATGAGIHPTVTGTSNASGAPAASVDTPSVTGASTAASAATIQPATTGGVTALPIGSEAKLR